MLRRSAETTSQDRTFATACPLPFRLGSGFDTGMETDLQAIIRRALAGPLATAYPLPMCRNITRDQQIEGWRTCIELLPKPRLHVFVVMAAALVAMSRRSFSRQGTPALNSEADMRP